MSTSSVTPFDAQIYQQIADLLGLSRYPPEVIDVHATASSDFRSDRQPARHDFSRQLGQSLGVAAGRFHHGVVKTVRFLGRRETKAAVMIAHWVTWSMAFIALMSLATSAATLWLLAALYVYISHIIWTTIDRI